MTISNIFYSTLISTSLLALNVSGQQTPIGHWRSHLPYNTGVSLAVSGTTIYVATEQSFFKYVSNEELQPFSKVDGMADIGMAGLAYDLLTNTVVLAYENSNIDLYQDGSFYNLPDLKLKTVAGSKRINQITADNGLAYLSTDVGIIVLNLEKREIKETYTFTSKGRNIAIKGLTVDGNQLYAATDKGLYQAEKTDNNLQDFASWTSLDTNREFISIANQDGTIFVTGTDSLFAVENGQLQFVYKSDTTTTRLDPGIGGVWVVENYKTFTSAARKIDLQYNLVDTIPIVGRIEQLVQRDDPDSTVFIVDRYNGLMIRKGRGAPYATIAPSGPSGNGSFDIEPYNDEVWVAHGRYDEFWVFQDHVAGMSRFKDEEWTSFDTKYFNNSVRDITNIEKGPGDIIYAGSHQNGLVIFKPNEGSFELYDENSILDDAMHVAPGKRIVGGLALDEQNNLWMTMFNGTNELALRTKEGNWTEFFVAPNRPVSHAAGHLIIDDNGQKWYTAPRGGGVMVYNDGNTPENAADDKYRQLLTGEGFGGLPNNTVYSITKDQNGAIWIGTATGIGIVNCPSQVVDGGCEATLNTVQYDDFAGYLFQNEAVMTIAVDGNNRKWIGTTNGIWLISPDGDQIISRFTAANSPLPSDRIQKIAIDPITGVVYIGTDLGLVSYRGTATEGLAEMDQLVTYPNPVPSGYNGTIAIKGLLENADVKITDVSGQLVYQTKALGGQAIWSGKDYTGRRPQSGVYLIFVTNKDGSQTGAGKLVFME